MFEQNSRGGSKELCESGIPLELIDEWTKSAPSNF